LSNFFYFFLFQQQVGQQLVSGSLFKEGSSRTKPY
jgi:hypothetical protein